MFDSDFKKAVDYRMHVLFEELVPMSGKCESLAGEIIRAANRIGYRYWNDGDQIGVGYGNETCNPAARFLMAKCPKTISSLVGALWGMTDDDSYESILYVALEKIASYVEENPELKNRETEDMWDYQLKEDLDYEDEEEEWEDYEDEE